MAAAIDIGVAGEEAALQQAFQVGGVQRPAVMAKHVRRDPARRIPGAPRRLRLPAPQEAASAPREAARAIGDSPTLAGGAVSGSRFGRIGGFVGCLQGSRSDGRDRLPWHRRRPGFHRVDLHLVDPHADLIQAGQAQVDQGGVTARALDRTADKTHLRRRAGRVPWRRNRRYRPRPSACGRRGRRRRGVPCRPGCSSSASRSSLPCAMSSRPSIRNCSTNSFMRPART